MKPKFKLQTMIMLLMLIALGVGSCTLVGRDGADTVLATSTPGEIPTWTPRPEDLSALPTATKPASVSKTESVPPTGTNTPFTTPTPHTVTMTVSGGNINVRRGPSIYYNYVGVLYDGETVVAIARDRISRWILVEIPSRPGARGWVTTETEYTNVEGDPSNLPFVAVEPASPAFIRNCTKHKIRINPTGVELLSKFKEPYNEEQFGVGVYQIYDLENPHKEAILEVSLSEGKTLDILYDWAGEKSKCD